MITCNLHMYVKQCLLYITTDVRASFAFLNLVSINFTRAEGFAECRSLHVETAI